VIFRRAFFGMVARMWDRELGPQLNQYRKTLGLEPVRDIWYGWCFSPDRVLGLFPEWFAPRQSDWPQHFTYGGFTVFDQGVSGEVPDSLREPGPPLVVIAAGSAGETAKTLFNAAIAAATGQPWRAVLLTGKDNPASDAQLPPNVLQYRFIPMSRLLPLSAAVVHHGGVGTISLALAAGIPQVSVPFGHDQFDNAARIKRLGVGRSILKPRDLATELRSAVTELLRDERMRARCREFQKKQSEDTSLASVCDEIESR
jgi:rhamnosyltransferase subunit B